MVKLLTNLRNNFLQTKDTLERFIISRRPNATNYANLLLTPIRVKGPKYIDLVTLEQESKYTNNQKLYL